MYEDQTPESIKATILSSVQRVDTREGSFADDMAGPVSVELYKLYGALEAVQPMVWVNETSGTYLDMAAADLGIEPRKAGTKAKVTLTISGTAAHRITKSTAFLTTDNLYFYTEVDTMIATTGTIDIEAIAERVGSVYNVSAGSVTLQYVSDAEISAVTNTAAALGGTNAETDAALYGRIDASRRKPSTSGNVYDYEKWALEVSGVGAAKVTPIWNGAGTVKVLIVDSDRQPVDALVVTSCAAHIEAERPVGASVTVKSAVALPINVSATMIIEAGTTMDAVKAAFSVALNTYLRSLAFVEYEVKLNRVGALIIGIDGVLDYSALKLNATSTSVTIGAEQVPTAGTVVFA